MKTANIIAALLLGAGLLFSANTPAQEQAHNHSDNAQHKHTTIAGSYTELASDHAIGKKHAPVSMIIYASVTCPHCAYWFNEIWPDFKKNYVNTGKVRVVFREFPTVPANIAAIGFQIANCAPKDEYFKMIELQMREQENIFTELEAGRGKEKYLQIAKIAGLENEAEMEKCITNEEGVKRINKAMELANSAGIHSVPNFIINGQVYKGNTELKPLAAYIDGLVSAKSTPIK